MSRQAFTVYWPRDRVKRAEAEMSGRRLEVMFGGPHQSEPSFRRAKVMPGDVVFPIYVRDRSLFVMGCMTVEEIIVFGAGQQDCARLKEYYQRFPDWRFLAPTCTDEVVLGKGSPISAGAEVPVEVLRRFTYRSQRAERTLKHIDDDGRLTHSMGVQGIYRLAPHSAEDLSRMLG